jgi:uncharacterized membrane protein
VNGDPLTITIFNLLQEGARGVISEPGAGGVEPTIVNAVQWLKLLVETIGALIIGLGVLTAASQFVRALIPPQVESYNKIRLTLARYLALALEFQLGAVIRTALNYFLTREMREERRGVSSDVGGEPAAGERRREG